MRDFIKMQWKSAAGITWTWPPFCALWDAALWVCLSSREHGFMFSIICVILHTTNTPKSIFTYSTSCVWPKHLTLVHLELFCFTGDLVYDFAQPLKTKPSSIPWQSAFRSEQCQCRNRSEEKGKKTLFSDFPMCSSVTWISPSKIPATVHWR